MGMERFSRLQALLPASAVVLGVDEHTAISLDLAEGQAVVRGKSGVSVLRAAESQRFHSEERFPMDVLRSVSVTGSRDAPAAEAAPPASDSVGRAAALIGAGDLPGGLRLAAEGAPPALAVLLLQAASHAEAAPPDDAAPDRVLEILIELRASLRERGEWALADGLRDRLLAVGFELRDTPQGTVWIHSPASPQSQT
jgi:hypothetical protein